MAEYEDYGLYFYQPYRSFKPAAYLAFYTDGEIKSDVPRIMDAIETIELTKEVIETAYSITSSQQDQLRDVVGQIEEANRNEMFSGPTEMVG